MAEVDAIIVFRSWRWARTMECFFVRDVLREDRRTHTEMLAQLEQGNAGRTRVRGG